MGLAFSKDSTAHLPRGAAFPQDSTAHPMYPPYFSKIRPCTRRKVSHFPKIPFRARCKPRIFPRFDCAPAARSRISPRFRFAPDVSPVFSQDSTFHLPRGRIREKYGSFQSYIHRFVLPLASIKPDHGSKSTRKWKRLQK